MDPMDFGDTSTSGVVSDADDGLSVSSHSTLDLQPIRVALRRPKRPLTGRAWPQRDAAGKRTKRRQMNDSYLQSLATVTEISEEDVTGIALPRSPLSLLFQQPERMRAWEEFSQLGDDDQLRFLGAAAADDGVGDVDGDGDCVTMEDAELKAVVVVAAAPVGGGERWRGLSGACRDFVLRKALPGSRFDEQLRQFEAELRDLFGDDCAPWADWIGGCRPPCERLLLHAVAGFLGLASASEDTADGAGRCICVRRRPGRRFNPPACTLSQFALRLRLRRQRLLAATFVQ